MPYAITDVNQMSQNEFVNAFGAVYEETPAIAAQAWKKRPFENLSQLHQAMCAVVSGLSETEQLTLIQAHPELGSKVQMAAASVQEQSGAGLSQMSATEYERFNALNAAYKEKFNFPFVMAIKGYGKTEILAAFEARLQCSNQEERARSLSEITQIARFRLNDLITTF